MPTATEEVIQKNNIIHIKGGDVWGSYVVHSNRMPVDVNTIAYMKGIPGFFTGYMASDDWVINYHQKFKDLIRTIPGCIEIKELCLSDEHPKPFMLEIVKDEKVTWFEFIANMEKAVQTFDFNF